MTCLAPVLVGCSVLFPSNNIEPPPPSTSWELHAVRVDSVGYLPTREKVATVVLPVGMTTIANINAEVRFAADDSVVWTCKLTGPMTDQATNSVYYFADFTEFDSSGDFYLAVPGLGSGEAARSATFHVADDVFRDALTRSMIGLYGQRCGRSVSITLDGHTFSHGACHKNDAYLDYLTGETTKRSSVGGWHDAGDYGKYITNGAFSAGMLLAAWEHFQPALATLQLPPIPEHGGMLPDFLAEVKWELDWLLATQNPDGSVAHKVTALEFESFLMPEADGQKRFYTPVGTAATADLVAALAQASRIYRPYDSALADSYLAAARLGYQYLGQNAGPAVPMTDSKGNTCATSDCSVTFHTGGYGQRSDAANRLWAAAELWETTGEAPFLADVETRIGVPSVDTNFDWDNVQNLGLFTYLMSARDGRDATLLAALGANATAVGDTLATAAQAAPFGRALSDYWWGSNGAVARTAMNLWVAYKLNPDPKYLDAIAMQLDHLLGRNVYDRTQVTAVGYHPPENPHHRPSVSDGIVAPWPGLLVGGSNPGPSAWIDDSNNYQVNEIAINWIAAFVYATAALTPAAN